MCSITDSIVDRFSRNKKRRTRKPPVTLQQSELKTARKAAGLTQFKLAVLAGLSVNAIQKIEAGDRTPMPETLLRLRAAVGKDIGRIEGER